MLYEVVTLRNEITSNVIDYNYLTSIFRIYRELTDAQEISYIDFKNIVTKMPESNEIYVYKYNNKPIGLITLIIENKLIHSGGRVGHIEDLAVDREYKNMSIGKTLINYCIDKCRLNGCYKVILNCKTDLEQYYIKNNFVNTGLYMTYRVV